MSRAGTTALLLAAFSAAFVSPPTVAAQNLLLADPDFDDGIGAWWTGPAQASSVGSDAQGCPASFAFHGQSIAGSGPSRVQALGSDCIPAAQGDELFLELAYLSERPVYLFLGQYAGADCATSLLVEFGDPFPAAAEWSVARRSIAVTSANVTGVRFVALAMDKAGPSTFTADFDRAYLGRVPRIFADDFEGGSSCRWEE